MDMTTALLFAIIALQAVLLLVVLFRKHNNSALTDLTEHIKQQGTSLKTFESSIKQDFQLNRSEIAAQGKENRTELSDSIGKMKTDLANSLAESIKGFKEAFETSVKSMKDLQAEEFKQLKGKQDELVKGTELKLEAMRATVEEKLEKTLKERIGQSFEQVGKQLESVQQGLGKMQTLAEDVGGLKKVLSNVKMRGGIGEVQLEMLLENILAPDQYEANVKTKSGSGDLVEFAIKLPGKSETQSQVWLPIDAKFPKDIYEQLQEAYEFGDLGGIETAQKNLDNTIKKMAKDISTKYIDPPGTTDFAIMFLPFEGIYAEVVRKASLLEELQKNFKVIVTGPTTLAAILNSLQMGFKTLAIQKSSSEVWETLGAVKTEFENFGGLLSKAQNNFKTGMNQLDDVMGVRTRAINRKLQNIESLSEGDTLKILPELANAEIIDEDEESTTEQN